MHHSLPSQVEPRGGVDVNAVDSAAMACQYGVTLALLLFFVLSCFGGIELQAV